MPTLTRARAHTERDPLADGRVLGSYQDPEGASRSVLAIEGQDGSTLVIDRREGAISDIRLVDRILADEPVLDDSIDNARLIAKHYLADPSRGRCRVLRPSDLDYEDEAEEAPVPSETLVARDGTHYRLHAGEAGTSGRTLRWSTVRADGSCKIVSLRTVIGTLEHYEPARSMTIAALTRHARRNKGVRTSILAAELRGLDRGAFVLNRGLREAAIRTVARKEASWSEIALRCGRIHAMARGQRCGDTSWLKRRLGIMPDSASGQVTPWLRAETLALIAHGLGVDPVSVEI
jgi:hypothetical protein